MAFDLSQMVAQRGIKRKVITLAPIEMTGALQSSLARIHRQMLAPWLDAQKKIMPLFEAELQRRLTQDNIDDLSNLFGQLDDEVSRLILNLTPQMREWAWRVETWHRGKWEKAVLAGTDIDISQIIGPAGGQESIETFMARNTALIRNVSNETRAKIADLVYRGLQDRGTSRQVAREITRQLGISRRRAVRIASDQANKLAGALTRQRQREAGFEFWKWRHSGKLHFRPEHKARDGIIYTDENAPADLPGQLPFCGCVSQAVLIEDEAEAAKIRNRKKATAGAAGVPGRAEPVAAPPPPPPPPAPAQAGYRSVINAAVNEATITVQKRLAIQKAMSKEFAEAAKAQPYQIPGEFSARKATDYGRAQLGAGFTDEAASVIQALKPEMDALSDQLGIPRMRGFKTITARNTNANMGDGIMGMNPTAFNSYATRLGGSAATDIVDELERKFQQLNVQAAPLREQLYNLRQQMQAARDAGDMELVRTLRYRSYDLSDQVGKAQRKADNAWRKWKDAQAAAKRADLPVSDWRPGQDPKSRPWTVKDYHESGVDKARSLLFHEFGHHVHQYLAKQGHRRQVGAPPLERELSTWFARADKSRMLSQYGTTNKHEWFAENFSAYVMGRTELMDDLAIELMERIFAGGYP